MDSLKRGVDYPNLRREHNSARPENSESLRPRSVRVAGDTGCERIHKSKKMQRAKFYFYFPRRRKGLGQRNPPAPSPEG